MNDKLNKLREQRKIYEQAEIAFDKALAILDRLEVRDEKRIQHKDKSTCLPTSKWKM
jgi:hypothetical protein